MKTFKIFYTMLLTIILIGCQQLNSIQNEELENELETNNAKEENIITSMFSLEESLKMFSEELIIEENIILDEISLLDEDLIDYSIFLTGEVHGVSSNADLGLSFLKFFNGKVGIDYYLSEMPYSMSFYINKYLSSGNYDILENVILSHKGTKAWSEEKLEFWINLYKYNQTLEVEEQISVIGIDVERDSLLAYKCLVELIPDKKVPAEIYEMVIEIPAIVEQLESSFQNEYKAEKHSRLIIKSINEYKDIYLNYFGEDFVYFELVNKNVVNYKETQNVSNDPIEHYNMRDSIIYSNFIALDEKLGSGKYYGQWGLAHIFKSESNGINWFAALLNNKNPNYSNKVYSIGYNYIDCKSMNSNAKEESDLTMIFSQLQREIGVNYMYTLIDLEKLSERTDEFYMVDVFTGEVLDKNVNCFLNKIVQIRDADASKSLDY